jgi:hypothetical protein
MSIWQRNFQKLPKKHIPTTKQQEVHVGSPAILRLGLACLKLCEAYGYGHIYMVGSATQHKDWRDVDVVFIMNDDKWKQYFGEDIGNLRLNPRWSYLCSLISKDLSDSSGLPIDFKFQSQAHANEKHGHKNRVPLGIFFNVDENNWHCYKCGHAEYEGQARKCKQCGTEQT